MNLSVRYYWEELRTSYWFLPAILGLAAITLSLATVSIDHEIGKHSDWNVPWTYSGGPEGARAVLATIAGSMITVAGVVFSITIVALHVAIAIQATSVIQSVSEELRETIDRLWPEELGEEPPRHGDAPPLHFLQAEASPVLATSSGYVDAIQNDLIMRLAKEHDLVIRLAYRPGHFAVRGTPLQPDQVVKIRDKPFSVPAEGVLDYQRFVVDPQWAEDKYIVSSEARPDKRGVVHHILVYVIPPGEQHRDLRQTLAGYAPGSPALQLEDGIAIEVLAGSKLLFEMHYTPNGTATNDLSYVGFRFAKKEDVRKRLRGQLAANHKFEIPAGAANHTVKATYVSRQEENLISMSPHMHLRGKSFRYDIRFPDGREDTLLNVPNYDFNWQLKYVLDQPIRLPKGTRVECTAVFDNSEYNLTNPDPSKPVRWGDQSFQEMMIGFMDTVPVKDEF